MTSLTATAEPANLVTQTRVFEGQDEVFAAWQQKVSDAVAGFPGFLDQNVMSPAPPSRLDWLIIQRFDSVESAQAWIASAERHHLVAEIEPSLVGGDDVHVFLGQQGSSAPDSVSAVISTHVAPGLERQYRSWQHRMAAAEAASPGFLSVKHEPPVPGVQEDWASVVQFDSQEHLRKWLESPSRRTLVAEGAEFSQEISVRTIRGDLNLAFSVVDEPSAEAAPAWKQNMIILLVLHPLAFLFAAWVLSPHLIHNGMSVPRALFIGALVKVVLLGYLLVPQANRAFAWWLTPRTGAPAWVNVSGLTLLLALYAGGLAIFSRFP